MGMNSKNIIILKNLQRITWYAAATVHAFPYLPMVFAMSVRCSMNILISYWGMPRALPYTKYGIQIEQKRYTSSHRMKHRPIVHVQPVRITTLVD